MIQNRILFFVVLSIMYSCHQGNAKDAAQADPAPFKPTTYAQYPTTLVLKEDNLRLNTEKFTLYPPGNDSIVLSAVKNSIPGSNGRFYNLFVKNGEQYNIMFPHGNRAFVNAGTQFSMSISPGKCNYLIRGKAWVKTMDDSAYIKTDWLDIYVLPGTKINIDNYPEEPNAIISVTQGFAMAVVKGENIPLPEKNELWLNKATFRTIKKDVTVDGTSWTTGFFRRWGVDFGYHMREIGRLYNKTVYLDSIKTNIFPINFNYRNTTIEQALYLYNSAHRNILLVESGDSLIITEQNRN